MAQKTTKTAKTKAKQSAKQKKQQAALQFSKDGKQVQVMFPGKKNLPISQSKRHAMVVLMFGVLNDILSNAEFLSLMKQVVNAKSLPKEDTDPFGGMSMHVVEVSRSGSKSGGSILERLLGTLNDDDGELEIEIVDNYKRPKVDQPTFVPCTCGGKFPHARIILPNGYSSDVLISKEMANAFIRAAVRQKEITEADGVRLSEAVKQSSLVDTDADAIRGKLEQLFGGKSETKEKATAEA